MSAVGVGPGSAAPLRGVIESVSKHFVSRASQSLRYGPRPKRIRSRHAKIDHCTHTFRGRKDRLEKTSQTDGAAAFRATLQLSEPTFVTIEVSAPHIKRQARTLSQTQLWLIPGRPLSGDGLIVEVPGMIVDVLSPQTHRYVPLSEGPFTITANVVMMCGCVLTSGGVWDGDAVEVAALVHRNGQRFSSIPLRMQRQMNTFSAPFAPSQPGEYRFTVFAYDPKTGNSGVDQTAFVITR